MTQKIDNSNSNYIDLFEDVPISLGSITNFLNNYNKNYIKTINNNFHKIIVESKPNDPIEILKKAYRDGNLVLVIGSGVSKQMGIPDWKTLMQKLLIDTLNNQNDENSKNSIIIAQLFSDLFPKNPLIAARYLRDHFKDNIEFNNKIRDTLYNNIDKSSDKSTIKEILNFIIAPGKSPNLDSIITYNFDDLLEKEIEKTKLPIPYEVIHKTGQNPSNKGLVIFHVHGYLPENYQLDSSNVVLSEDIYHKLYYEMYNWNNLLQINKFKEKTCLFIGTSLSDPNLRRLLDISKKLRGNGEYHFIIKEKQDKQRIKNTIKQYLDSNKNLLDEKIKAKMDLDEAVNEIVNLQQNFEEKDALSLCVSPIWVKEYNSEIPSILKSIRK